MHQLARVDYRLLAVANFYTDFSTVASSYQ